MNTFPAKVREKLKYYVYLYIDPRDGEPFYIGKGKGNRAFGHLNDTSETEKVRFITELSELGLTPRIELLKYGLTEKEALLVEATAIDLLDVKKLTNISRGHGSRHGARASADEVVSSLDPKRVDVSDPAILININRAYRHGMLPIELYDATRSAWIVGTKRDKATVALSVYRGVVREVYKIETWVPGRSSMRHDDSEDYYDPMQDRWEFIGKIAEDTLRKKYYGKSVGHYFKKGARNPIKYVNC